jgi:branched-subunit amino acid ABC-type transport system permease component
MNLVIPLFGHGIVPLQGDVGYMMSQVFNGLVLGMIFVLIALGLSIIFGLMGVVNFAHGEFLLVGVYVALAATQATGTFVAGLIAAPITVAVLGFLVERFTLRPIYDRNVLLQILLTFGLAEILREAVQIVWGRTGKPFPTPGWANGSIDMVLFQYPLYRAFVILAGAVVLAGVYFLFTQTDIGLVIRASTEDREMVNALGIDVKQMYIIVFILGSAIAGLAGALIGPIRGARPLLGFNLIVPAFVVVVVGGLGSLRGSIIAGLLIGQIVVLSGVFISSLSSVIIYIFMAAVLLIRPRGLFGREVELE